MSAYTLSGNEYTDKTDGLTIASAAHINSVQDEVEWIENYLDGLGLGSSNFSVTGTITAGTGLIATTGGLTVTAGGATITAGNVVIASGTLTVSGLITAQAGLTVSGGNLGVSAGTITASGLVRSTGGGLQASTTVVAGTTITAGTGLTVTTGNLAVLSGTITASGNISSSGGNLSANGTVTGGTGLIATAGGLTVSAGGASITGDSIITGDLEITGDITGSLNGAEVHKISQTVTYDQFTDNLDATGQIDLTDTIPVGAHAIVVLCTALTGFIGDTSATVQIGDGTDPDRYNTGTPDVFSDAANGISLGDPSGDKYHDAVATVRVLITTATDFTLVSAGSITLEIFYLT